MPNPNPSPSTAQAPSGWFTANNPVLNFGERGIETDTGNFKVGDGATKWKSLAYGGGGLANITGSRGGATATVLAQVLTALAARGEITDSTTA